MGLYEIEFSFPEKKDVDLNSIIHQVQQRSGLDMGIDFIHYDSLNFTPKDTRIGKCTLWNSDSNGWTLWCIMTGDINSNYLMYIILGVFKDMGAIGLEEDECTREPWSTFEKPEHIVVKWVKAVLEWSRLV